MSLFSIKIDCRLLTFWYKLHFSDTHKLSTALYCLVRQLYDEGAIQCSWLQTVQTKLNRLGFGGLWLAPTGEAAHNPTWFKEAIMLRMRDNFLQSWHEQTWNSSLCRLYRGLVDYPTLNKSLCSLDKSSMISVVRFRCGNMAFPSNYHLRNDPLRDPQCHLCGDSLGDEFHFLLVCPAIRAQRKMLLNIANHQRPSMPLFKRLVCTIDRKELIKLAKFIKVIQNHL